MFLLKEIKYFSYLKSGLFEKKITSESNFVKFVARI